MDLNDLDHWTRRALEAEAQRRGIRDPHLRTRTALIRLLLRKAYGDPLGRGRRRLADGLSAWRRAREVVGAVVEVAAETFTRTIAGEVEAPGGHEAGPPVTQHPQTPPSSAPAVQPPADQPPADQSPAAPEPASAQPVATERTFEREPIRTHSMARLLAHQGHRERSLAIYETLLAQGIDDGTLKREAALVRDGRDLSQIPCELPSPPAPSTPARQMPTGDDRIQCESGQDGLSVHWSVTPEGTARATAVLGRQGELAVRMVSIAPDPERVVRTTIAEYGPVSASGAWQTTAGPEDRRCFVSVGVRSEDRFVSIAHTQPAPPAR